MKKELLGALASAAVAFLFVAIVRATDDAEAGHADPLPSPTPVASVSVAPAPIHDVVVNIAESAPPQIFVVITAGLPDGCAKPGAITVQRNGDIINVDVSIERSTVGFCSMVYGTFTQTLALGRDFDPGVTYTVRVNGVDRSFTV